MAFDGANAAPLKVERLAGFIENCLYDVGFTLPLFTRATSADGENPKFWSVSNAFDITDAAMLAADDCNDTCVDLQFENCVIDNHSIYKICWDLTDYGDMCMPAQAKAQILIEAARAHSMKLDEVNIAAMVGAANSIAVTDVAGDKFDRSHVLQIVKCVYEQRWNQKFAGQINALVKPCHVPSLKAEKCYIDSRITQGSVAAGIVQNYIGTLDGINFYVTNSGSLPDNEVLITTPESLRYDIKRNPSLKRWSNSATCEHFALKQAYGYKVVDRFVKKLVIDQA